MSAIDEFLEYREQLEKTAMAPPTGGMWSYIKSGLPFLGSRMAGEAVEGAGKEAVKTFPQKLRGALEGGALTLATLGVLGGGLGAGESAWEAASSAIGKHRGFKKMMKVNPELGEQDKTKIHAAYSTLHRFNPEMASDPFVAGSWVKQVSEYDAVPTKTVGDLIAARAKTDKPSFMQRTLPLASMALQQARESQMSDPEHVQAMARAQAKGKRLTPEEIEEDARAKELGKLRAGLDPAGMKAQRMRAETQEAVKMRFAPDPRDLEYHKTLGKEQAQAEMQTGLVPSSVPGTPIMRHPGLEPKK